MSFFSNMLLNLIIVLSCILGYIVVKIYLVSDPRKDKVVLAGMTGLMLIFLFMFNKFQFFELSLFLVIPILLNYIRNNRMMVVLLSVIMIFVNNYFFKIASYVLILEYLIYYLCYLYSMKKKIDIREYMNKFIIIRSFFLSLYCFYLFPNNDFNISISYIILSIIFLYLISFGFYYLFKNSINILEVSNIKKRMENQNNVKNYLCAVTHELKNSLSISKGYLEMIASKRDYEKNKDYLRIVRKEVNRSIDMIQEGLNLSKDKIDYEILDVNVLLEDVSDTLKDLFKKKNIQYGVNYIDDDIYILGDYDKLKQVLINVLKNSMEARDNNLVIKIDNEIIKNDICISIKDNGYGIKDFEMLEKGMSSKTNGSGIGTVFSKNVIDKHNGRIVYESSRDDGTTVNIFLPLFR